VTSTRSSIVVMRTPDRRLRPLLDRDLLGFRYLSPSSTSWVEPPRPALTLMIDLEGRLRADGAVLPSAWVGGLSDVPARVELRLQYASLDLKLTPLGAFAVFGVPLSELARRTVGLDDLLGRSGSRLVERLHCAPDWDGRFDVLERYLLARACTGPAPTPVVVRAWHRLRESAGTVRIEALANELGCSRRYLTARFIEQIGVSPKTAARLMRFEWVCHRLERSPPRRLARIAQEAGYFDQSHLNRDFCELAGTTPADFCARVVPGRGQVPFVQDTGTRCE
jgi:AraC-like DNA-binding protein